MSGQPLIHPTDASKFREQYLATLAQTIKNDDKNLQANKIYKKTGQTPSIVLDTRTGAEKLADIYRLKIDLRSGLKDIMDGTTAERVVQELDNNTLMFLSQRLPEIISILKPKYKFGIPFVSFTTFLREYMTSTQQTGDYLAGFQQKSGKQVLMGIQQILGQMVNKDNLDDVKKFIAGKSSGVAQAVRNDLEDLYNAIPSKDYFLKTLTGLTNQQNVIITEQIIQQMSDAFEELPTRQQIEKILFELEATMKIGDKQRQEELLWNLHNLLAVSDETKEQLALVRKEIGDSRDTVMGKIDEQTGILKSDNELRREEESRIRQISERLSPQEKVALEQVYVSNQGLPTDELKRAYIDARLSDEMIKGTQNKGDFLRMWGGQNTTKALNKEGLKNVVDEINKRIFILTSGAIRIKEEEQTTPTKRGRPRGQPAEEPAGRGIKGRSITKEIDYSKGVMTTPPKYVPFGRFHINTNKLGDDIVNMRRHTGCNVYGLPVKRVSQDLGSVLRTIVGGGQPEYRQLEKLSDEEKVYLTNLVKKAQIGDRLSIPTPNKDDDDKDIHQYEVMKGEILSGNDNVDMVKKFKILIMKMMRKELLPKSQAKEILLDLATLGY